MQKFIIPNLIVFLIRITHFPNTQNYLMLYIKHVIFITGHISQQ